MTDQMPVIYLDIDGVLLANDQQLAIGAKEFIKYVVDNFEVYWLTTHCTDGNAARAVKRVQDVSDEDLTSWLSKIIGTSWDNNLKTNAIDFSRPFIWFDDDCFTAEKQVLQEHGALDSWYEVELRNHPDQLIRELKVLKSM